MGDFNRVLSFILGLIVVVVFLVIVFSRFNVKEKLSSLRRNTPKVTVTPTPTPIVVGMITPTPKVSTIPNTGAPTLLLPLALMAFVGGFILRKA